MKHIFSIKFSSFAWLCLKTVVITDYIHFFLNFLKEQFLIK